MIVAQEKTSCCNELPGRVTRPKKARRNRPVPAGGRLALTGLVVVFFLVGIMITYYYSRVLTLGFQISQLEQELTVLRVENHNLDGEIQKLVSLDRVEAIAVHKLGMIKPAGNDVLYVAVAGKTPQQPDFAVNEEQIAGISPAGKEENPLIRAFTELVNRLENKIWLGSGMSPESEEGTDANDKHTYPEKNHRALSFWDAGTHRVDSTPGLDSVG
ncbi:MAG TPA: cell division protein FtsL [Bacillota bacterium]|nr:cell division protein FtsL [Bacillota bacterium]